VCVCMCVRVRGREGGWVGGVMDERGMRTRACVVVELVVV
jgi:hypothetical protein